MQFLTLLFVAQSFEQLAFDAVSLERRQVFHKNFAHQMV
jgi:hypothetical protein